MSQNAFVSYDSCDFSSFGNCCHGHLRQCLLRARLYLGCSRESPPYLVRFGFFPFGVLIKSLSLQFYTHEDCKKALKKDGISLEKKCMDNQIKGGTYSAKARCESQLPISVATASRYVPEDGFVLIVTYKSDCVTVLSGTLIKADGCVTAQTAGDNKAQSLQFVPSSQNPKKGFLWAFTDPGCEGSSNKKIVLDDSIAEEPCSASKPVRTFIVSERKNKKEL